MSRDSVRTNIIPGIASEAIVRPDFISNEEGLQTLIVTIDAQAADTGNTGETHKLRAGLVLGIVTSGGKYKEYDSGNGDGTENARAILFANVDRLVSTAVVAQVCYGGTLRAAGLHSNDVADGIDDGGKEDLIARGTKFTDKP